MNRNTLALLAATVLVLSSCVGDDDGADAFEQTSASASPTPTESAVEKDASYGTADELMEAAVAAGYHCKNWRLTNKVALAASSGNCSDADVFAVYATESDRDAQINQQRDFSEEFGMEMSTVLVGQNWTINSPKANDLREAMGGVIFGG